MSVMVGIKNSTWIVLKMCRKWAKNRANKKLRVQCTATNLNLNNCRARTGAYKKVFVFFVFLIVFVFEE